MTNRIPGVYHVEHRHHSVRALMYWDGDCWWLLHPTETYRFVEDDLVVKGPLTGKSMRASDTG